MGWQCEEENEREAYGEPDKHEGRLYSALQCGFNVTKVYRRQENIHGAVQLFRINQTLYAVAHPGALSFSAVVYSFCCCFSRLAIG
jgi:hypothetical protein